MKRFEKLGTFFKVDAGQGIAYGWAIVCTDGGKEYVDLQGDHIPESAMLDAAADFAANSRVAKDMHSGDQVGEFLFLYPITKSSADLGIDSRRTGLLVGFKPDDPAMLGMIKNGDRTGFSIGGTLHDSFDEPLGKSTAFAKDAGGSASATRRTFRTFKINEISLVDRPAQEGATVGYVKRAMLAVRKATWTAATIDDLPDSSFLYVEPGGKKDDAGKTTPRSLRHFPYRDENGKIDIDHLRDAVSRIPQSSLPATLRNKLQVKAEKLLAAQHTKSVGKQLLRKEAVLTSETDGHQHSLNLDDPAQPQWWGSSLSTSYQNAEGADQGHSHAWTFDPTTGAITIAMDSGHDHTVKDVVPADALAAFAAIDAEQDARNEEIAAVPVVIDDDPSDGIPGLVADEVSSGAVQIDVTVIQARAPKSTPRTPATKVAAHQEPSTMPNELEKQVTDLTKQNERLGRIAKMSGAHKSHFDTLAGDNAEAFLAKSDADRDVVTAEITKRNDEADKVIYISKATGDVYKAKDDQRLVEMAKRMDVQADEIEKADVRKAAVEILGGMPGDDATHDLIVRSLRKSGAKTEDIDKAIATLKGMKASSSIGKRAGGSGGANPDVTNGDPEVAMENLEKGLKTFCKAQSITKNLWTDGLNAFVQTTEGAALKQAVDDSTAS